MINERFRRKYDIEESYKKHTGTTITEQDAEIIRNYIAYRQSVSPDLTPRAANNLVITLIQARRYIKSQYAGMTIKAFRDGIAALKHGASEDTEEIIEGKKVIVPGEPYKTNTIKGKVKYLKSFARWLNDEGYTSLRERDIKEIKPPKTDYFSKTGDDILTPDEINRLIAACKSNRDRALIGLLYECAARCQEVGNLTWGDITGDEYSLEVQILDYKTKVLRTGYMAKTGYMDLVITHKNSCGRAGDNDFVFMDNRNQGMTYDAIKMMLKRTAKRADIKKKITPHVFRTSRITNMAAENYPDMAIRDQAWGNQATAMYAFYVKPNKKMVKRMMLAKAGVVEAAPAAPAEFREIKCPKCGFTNGAGIDFCGKCSTPLTEKAKSERQKWIEKANAYDQKQQQEFEEMKRQLAILMADKAKQ